MALILPSTKTSKKSNLVLPGQQSNEEVEYFGTYPTKTGMMSGKIPLTNLQKSMVERQFNEQKSEWIKPVVPKVSSYEYTEELGFQRIKEPISSPADSFEERVNELIKDQRLSTMQSKRSSSQEQESVKQRFLDTYIPLFSDKSTEQKTTTPTTKEISPFGKKILPISESIESTVATTKAAIKSAGINVIKGVATVLRIVADDFTKPLPDLILSPEVLANKNNNEWLVSKGFTDKQIKELQTRGAITAEAGKVGKWIRESWAKPTSESSEMIISKLNDAQRKLAEPIFDKVAGLSNFQEYLYTAISGGMSYLEAFGIYYLTKSEAAAITFLSTVEASDEYNKALDAGKTKTEATNIAFLSGVGTAALEKLGFDMFFNINAANWFVRSFLRGSAETAQELTQTAWQNMVAKYGYDDSITKMDGWWETIVGVAPVAFLFGGAAPADISQQFTNDVSNKTGLSKDKAKEFIKEFREGASSMYRFYVEAYKEFTPEIKGLTIKDVSKLSLDERYEISKNALPKDLSKLNARNVEVKLVSEMIKRDVDVGMAKLIAENIAPDIVAVFKEGKGTLQERKQAARDVAASGLSDVRKGEKLPSEIADIAAQEAKTVEQNLPYEASNLSPEEKIIQQKISNKDFESIIERFYPKVKSFYEEDGISNYKEYLEKVDPEAIDLEMDNDFQTNRAIHDLLEDEEISVGEVLYAYRDGILRDEISREAFTPNVGLPENIKAPKGKFYSPGTISKNVKKIYADAKQKINSTNKKAVLKAREALYVNWATDRNLADKIGVKQSELNRVIKTQSGSNVEGGRIQSEMNENVPLMYRWYGITNSNFLKKNTLSLSDIDKVVNNIDDSTAKLGTQRGDMLRQDIMHTLLAIDTRMTYDNLNFKIENLDRALGNYNNSNTTITISNNSQNTTAHEIGHYLDYKFARELGMSIGPLSDGTINYEYLAKEYNLSSEHIAWAKEFVRFTKDINKRSEIGGTAKRAEYLQKPTESFARFIDRFVDWTASKSGFHYSESNYYEDKFYVSDFKNFIKLIQKKGQLDVKHNIKDLTTKTSGSVNKDEGGITPEKGVIPKELQPLAKEARKYKSAEEFVKAQKGYVGEDTLTRKPINMVDEIDNKPKYQKTGDKEFDAYSMEYYQRYEKEIKPQLLADAKKSFDEPGKVKVIDVDMSGSYKRGTPNPESDLDVKVYYEGTKPVEEFRDQPETLSDRIYGIHDVHFQKVEPKKQLTDIYAQATKEVKPVDEAKYLKGIREDIIKTMQSKLRNVATIKSITKKEVKAVQTALIEKIDASKLEAKDKAKFTRAIKNVQTAEQLAKVMPEIQDRITILEEKATKKTTKKKIINEFKKLKAKKAEKGKTSVEFEMLRNALRTKYFEDGKLSGKLRTQVENDILFKELQANIENYDIGNPIDYEDFVLYAVLSESTKGLDEMSTAGLKDVLTRLQQTKKLARDSFIFKQLDRASEIKKLIDKSVENMQGKGMRKQTLSNKITITKKLRQFVSTADIHDRGFLQIINLLDSIRGGRFYKDALYQPISEANKEYFKADEAAFAKDEKMLKEAFGTSGTKFDLKINKLGKQVNIGKVIDAQNNEIDLWFSNLEMIDIYLSSKTKANLEAMKENGIYVGGIERSKRVFYMTDNVIEKIISKMSPEAKKMAEYISKNILDKDFNRNMTQAYEAKYNKPFPYVKDGYWTIRRRRMGGTKKQKEADVFNPIYSQQTILSPSSFKERIENQNPLKITDGWAKYIKWRTDILKFVSYDTALTNAKSIIMSSEIASEFTERYGQSSYRHLLNSFDVTANGVKNYDDKFASGSNYIRQVLSVAFIGGKLRNILSQGTSFVAAISDIPARDLNKSLGKFVASPKKAYSKMMESPIIRLRHKRANFSKGLLESEMKAIKKQGISPTNVAMFFTKAGDMLGVLGAGYAIYDYNYNQYISEDMGHKLADKRAMQDAENFVVSTQQSALNELKNQIMQAHPFIRTAGAFQQAQSMYRAKGFESINTWVNSDNKWSKPNFNKMAKGVFTYHFVLPALYELSRGNINPLSITAKTIFSPISGFMGYGKVVEYGIMFAIVKLLIPLFGGDDDDWKDILPFDPNTLIGESKVIFDRTVNSMNDLIEGEGDEKDINNLIDAGLMFLSVPSKNIREEYKKFQDIFSGKDATFLRFLQTEWQSEQRLKETEKGRQKWGAEDKKEEDKRQKWGTEKKESPSTRKKWGVD